MWIIPADMDSVYFTTSSPRIIYALYHRALLDFDHNVTQRQQIWMSTIIHYQSFLNATRYVQELPAQVGWRASRTVVAGSLLVTGTINIPKRSIAPICNPILFVCKINPQKYILIIEPRFNRIYKTLFCVHPTESKQDRTQTWLGDGGPRKQRWVGRNRQRSHNEAVRKRAERKERKNGY